MSQSQIESSLVYALTLNMIHKLFLCGSAVGIDIAIFCSSETGSKSYDALRSLIHIWAVACLRLAILYSVSLLSVGSLKPVLKRVLAGHCLLAPVYETGRVLTYGWPEDSASGRLGGLSAWVLCTVSTAAAALFWETSIPDSDGQNGKENKRKARVLFMRVIRFYKPDFLLLVGAFVFLSLAVLCEMFIPFYTGKVIDILGSQYQWADFRSAILFMALYSFGSSFSAGCRGGMFMCCISSFTCRIKVLLFGALVKQEIGLFDAIKTGDITSRLSKDTTLMGRTVALNVNVMLRTLIKTGGMLSLMTSLSWKLTLLMLMETPVTGLMQSVHDSHYQRLSQEVQNSIARANEAAGEAVGGVRVVRSFNTLRGEARRYDNRLMDTHNLKTKRDTVRSVYLLMRRLTEVGMKVIMLYYGRLFIQRGQMTTGNLVTFIMYQEGLANNIRTLIYIFGDMLNSVGAADKVFEYLDREPQVRTNGTLEPDQLQGHVQFQNLTFSYPSCPDNKILQEFSLELLPGQVTALVGASGGGKSTCVSLLEHFYQPQKGEILLDGKPLHTYEHRYLHTKVAMVGQEPVLFAGSVRDNIAYGLEDCSLEKVQEAACRANAHNFICQLEKGYDTDVGERGGLLSAGQKQRIAIARALIREPQVLILDEVTSALDTESEHMIQQTLAKIPSLTLLVIAHRLKTIEEADRIAVIGEGKVQEQGTHQELMDRKGTYYKLREKLFTEEDKTQ